MERKYELKETDIKNCTCYYFSYVIRVGDFDFDNILLDENLYENSYENILIYDISYKTFMGAKPLCIRFNKFKDLLKFMLELDI